MLWKRGIFVVMAVHLVAVSPACGQSLGGTAYTDKYEISIYQTSSAYSQAKEFCSNMKSRLVKVDSNDITNAITSMTTKNMYYWIEGSDLQTEREWKWNDNTTVQKFGWNVGEPNGQRRENCLAIAQVGWLDYGCDWKFAYICEKVGANNMKLSSTNFDVRHDKKGITCTVDGYPTPNFSWTLSGYEISLDSSSPVYQEKTESGTILYIRNATLLDEGEYICRANNTIGNTQYEVQASSTIKVPSHPSLNIYSHLCNPSLSIFWTPNERATKLQHSIVIRRSYGENWTTSTPTPGIPTLLRYSTANLSSWTIYTVSVTPCLPTAGCKTEYSVSKKVRTAGIPRKISSIMARIVSPTSCALNWKPPESVPIQSITGYEINITEVLVQTPSGHKESATSKKLSPGNATSYIFHGKPNRRNSFGIQAKTCAGSGPVVWSSQSCNTSQQAPTTVPTPTLRNKVNNEGEMNVTIHRLDQENGLISCLFVIVKSDVGNTTNNRTTYTLNHLRKANRSASSVNTTDEYISVALVVSREDGQLLTGQLLTEQLLARTVAK